jgi:2-iminobutanoate/2-iminopropanoate deaminase
MQREVINSPSVRPSGLPFSPALKVGNWVFLSGQAAHASDGSVPATIEEQTELTLSNVAALLEAAGAAMTDVVSVMVHLTDIGEFGAYNEVYQRFFPEPRPTRTTVQAVLVGTLKIEITVVAHIDAAA